MPNMLRSIFYMILFSACTDTIASDSSETRWSFSINGFPVIEGDVVVRVGVGSRVRYTAGSTKTTIQLSMAGETVQSLVISNKETKVTCMKSSETEIANEKGRLVFSGAVNCLSNPANPRERESHALSGWFGLED